MPRSKRYSSASKSKRRSSAQPKSKKRKSKITPKRIISVKKAPIFEAIQNGNIDLVRKLIKKNVDLNETDRLQRTPIFEACAYGNFEIFKMLMDAKVNLEKKDIFGFSALIISCTNCQEAAKILIKANVDLESPNNNGKTPFMVVCYEGIVDIAKLLISANVNMEKPDDANKKPWDVADVEIKTLIAAARRKNSCLLKLATYQIFARTSLVDEYWRHWFKSATREQ